MKILVTCFSQTGNTYQIAEAIHEELAQSNETDLMTTDKIDSESISDYNLLFIGSPIHAGGLAANIKDFLETFPDNHKIKLAAFITHASSALNKKGFEMGIQQFDDICRKKAITYLGCYDCQGRLAPELHDMVQKAQKASDEE